MADERSLDRVNPPGNDPAEFLRNVFRHGLDDEADILGSILNRFKLILEKSTIGSPSSVASLEKSKQDLIEVAVLLDETRQIIDVYKQLLAARHDG